jgi:D-inositol-3-phosphate glycosyltransferase
MRVAMVSEHASPLAVLGGVDAGGQNVHVAALAGALARRGHAVTVHTRREDLATPDRVPLQRGMVVVDHVPMGPPTVLPKDDLLDHVPEMAAALRERWREERPDVVHAHFWMSGLAALEAARPLGIPVVQTFHALGVVKRRHQGVSDTSPEGRIQLERQLAQGVDRVVATCSDEVFELVRLGVDRRRTTVVPCGVDLRRFAPEGPRAGRPPHPRHRIVSLSRLVERKGVGNVIRALAQVPDAELVIAGGPPAAELDGDREARRFRALAAEHGVADRVWLVGRVERPDVPALLRSADVVCCTPWYEPFGIVPLEAMACGVPVVAAAVGGLQDTVVHGVTGLHVPPREPDAIAEALNALLDDPQRRRAMGRAGVARARERYGWDRIAAGTEEAYARVIAPAARERATASATATAGRGARA